MRILFNQASFLLILLLAMIATLTPPAGAAPPEEALQSTWSQANHAYQARQYAKAARLYERLLEQGMSAADLCLNLGNTYYQLGQSGKAAWMYEKALVLNPREKDARRNLTLIRPPLAESETQSATFFLFRPAVCRAKNDPFPLVAQTQP
jgi:Tfp pilus assembly protein PilF